MKNRLVLLILSITITSCGVETYDSKEAYQHWENNAIGEDVEIINGQFWKSGHWTYEYSVFLELQPSKRWKDKFFELYNAEENSVGKYDSEKHSHQIQAPHWFETPEWIKLNSEFEVYTGYGGNFYWNEKEKIYNVKK